MEYYSFEPQHNLIDPTTVAALIGLFIGARNRLAVYGAPVGKDAFDVDAAGTSESPRKRRRRAIPESSDPVEPESRERVKDILVPALPALGEDYDLDAMTDVQPRRPRQ